MLVPNEPDWNERFKNAGGTKLSALLTIGVREIGYVYDMGDNWQHRIIVEKLKPAHCGYEALFTVKLTSGILEGKRGRWGLVEPRTGICWWTLNAEKELGIGALFGDCVCWSLGA